MKKIKNRKKRNIRFKKFAAIMEISKKQQKQPKES